MILTKPPTQCAQITDRSAINSVADTALWTATIRALEGKRADAVFHDPLASVLAGERGLRITRSFSRPAMVSWGVVVRTSAIDRLINEALQTGVDTVLNLGAGLDTRPYRMDLPEQLRWIEIDFPNIIELKNSTLVDRAPACRLERVGMDLLDRSSRNELFARYGAISKKILVIAEGVIPYFANDDAAALARDLFAVPSIALWIQDFDNAGKRRLPGNWAKKLKAAPFLFQVNDWFEFYRQAGWRSQRKITSAEESARINRPFPVDFPFGLIALALPRKIRQTILGLSGAVLMAKNE